MAVMTFAVIEWQLEQLEDIDSTFLNIIFKQIWMTIFLDNYREYTQNWNIF